jgi:hypothetical protein
MAGVPCDEFIPEAFRVSVTQLGHTTFTRIRRGTSSATTRSIAAAKAEDKTERNCRLGVRRRERKPRRQPGPYQERCHPLRRVVYEMVSVNPVPNWGALPVRLN